MAFAFKKKQSVRKSVKRLGYQRLEKATGALTHCERLEAIHDVRKDLKQLRALLRLVNSAMPKSRYRRTSDTLREAARMLSAARDVHVKLNALAALVQHFHPELAPRSFREIKHLLAEDCRQQQAELRKAKSLNRSVSLLKKLSRDPSSFRLKASGWRAIGPGLESTYRKGRRLLRRAERRRTPGCFHEWRKRVKDLFYQIGLLCPLWPEQMTAAESELQQLGECLGDDNDLFLLTEPRALKRFKKQARQEVEALKALVDKRQTRLRREALALGARFYQEKPSVFCRRIERYWKRWRHEPKPAVPAR